MPSFDLLTEPWIPVLDAGVDLRATPEAPATLREIGLREALQRAHELREVYTDSPLETIALNRLLLALVLDVYQPTPDEDAWLEVWRAGRLPPEPLGAYLDEWGDRFNLLHGTYPFFQRTTKDPSQEGKDPAPLANLFHEQASGNNATLFGHDIDAEPQALPLAQAARGLVVIQAAALGGGASKPFYFSHAPLIGRAQFWIRGRSLFEALWLNAPPTVEARMGAAKDDAPVWRREAPEAYRKRLHRGVLDVLTWPSRRLTLVAEVTDEDVMATGIYLTQGDKLDPDPSNDPLAAYVESDKKGRFPLRFRTDRAVWRDADTLFNAQDPSRLGAPETFRWLARVSIEEPGESSLDDVLRTYGFDAFGLVNDQAKAELWRHERLPLHVEVLREPARLRYVKDALKRAESVVRDKKHGLRRAIRVAAEYVLAAPPPGDDGHPNADTKAVTAFAKSLGAERRYWAALEPAFFDYFGRVAQADDDAARDATLTAWQKTTNEVALHAYDAATSSFDGDARHLRAFAEGRSRLYGLKPPELEADASGNSSEPSEPLPELAPLPMFL